MTNLKQTIFSYESLLTLGKQIQEQREIIIKGVPGFLKACIPAFLVESGLRVLWIAPRSSSRETALSDLSQLLPDDQVSLLPAPGSDDDVTPFETRIFRTRALKTWTDPSPSVLITEPAATWLKLLPSREECDRIRIHLIPGIHLGRDWLAKKLLDTGYSRCDMVENRGDYALRGHILDVYPYTHDTPLRLEFWGEQLDSLRSFDAQTQRTINHLKNETLFLSHVEGGNQETIGSYATPNDIIFVEEPEDAQLLAEKTDQGEIFRELLSNHRTLYWGSPRRDIPILDFRGIPQEDFGGHIQRLAKSLVETAQLHTPIYIACETQGQADRLNELLSDRNVDPLPRFLVAHVSGGFKLPDGGPALYTDHQIFRRPRRRRTYFRLRNFSPIQRADRLKRGDYVVHEEFGIGRYLGLETIQVGGHTRECLQIEYAHNVMLYIRLESLRKIQKYSGREGFTPPLTRIGRGEWERIRKRAQKAVKALAGDLLKLYALRAAGKGYAFPKDDALQLELEAGFEYEETPDQIKAISDVKKDMEASRPMDRLVCGDVGYGKTEVALRAAFKAVLSGKQVGVLVPTTLLAQQHYTTFRQRLVATPIEVEMLSRFRSKKQQVEILQKLRKGTIDIIIGTHRLLSKDVKFHNLGLLIVDEEHRFGVRHKERIKSLKAQIDVLVLTATPIPRTLHMALIGARDMSLINTAPQDRLPIETEIAPFSKELITDAILQEVGRGGQVYFVHNRVETIGNIKRMLEQWLPEIRFTVGHGQMPEKQLEATMIDFLNRKYDCLISTMIIESGLDLPNVNTMIVNRADRFGLAQLYQLRGRIGRSNRQAYAYLLTPPRLSVSDPARRRLEAIRDCSYLGAGFQLAMHDLEIRGAGEIFGAKQSGFIHSVGFDLYQKMLSDSITELQTDSNLPIQGERKPALADFEPKVEFPFDAYLPTDYIEAAEQRVDLYRRLSAVKDDAVLQDIIEETTDRYGAPPRQAQALFDLVALKLGCLHAGLPRLELHEQHFLAEIGGVNTDDWSERLAKIVSGLQDVPVEFNGNDPPEFLVRWESLHDWNEKIQFVKEVIKKIA